MKRAALALGMTLLLLVVFGLHSRVRYGSVKAGLRAAAGDPLVCDEPYKKIQSISEGDKVSLRYRLFNTTGRRIRILGTSASCTCATISDLPQWLGPTSEVIVQITVTAQPAERTTSGVVKLLLSDPECPEFPLAFQGRAKPLATSR